jgi:hypothetical protein
MASLLSSTTATILTSSITAFAPAVAHCEYVHNPRRKEYPTGRRASGAAVVASAGREYGARVVGVKWEHKGRDNAAGFTGWEPVPVFRVGNERPPCRHSTVRPHAGRTMPRRRGAHGR